VWVLAENTAREPILHQCQERVCGCEIPRIAAGISGLTRCCGVIPC
jgi:hypothetical protein